MINYKAFIEDNFKIKTKTGEIVPFIFNDTQTYGYNLLKDTYDTQPGVIAPLSGVRENWLKFRQFGGSALIDAMFLVDFIYSELGKIPIINADVTSHNEAGTLILFDRVSFFLDSYLDKKKGPGQTLAEARSQFLKVDQKGQIAGRRGAEFYVQTASARVSGRGGTKQNLHWSEVAFYSQTDKMNAKSLVGGAEEQVADGVGKIFRETTGGMTGDFFHGEYKAGKEPEEGQEKGTDFHSRFLGWWLHKEYRRHDYPQNWQIPEYYEWVIREHRVDREQCYWHFRKVHKLENGFWILDPEKLREYPSSEEEAFLSAGSPFFDRDALIHYTNMMQKPMTTFLLFTMS